MENVEKYRGFLLKTRKRNGEKLLPKTIDIYSRYIERFEEKLESDNVEDMVSVANSLIYTYPFPNLRSALKFYIMFRFTLEPTDERLHNLKIPQKRASALTSLRELTNKVIPPKDLQLLYDSLDEEWRLILGMYYESGARESEILNARVKDITFYDESEKGISSELRILGKGGKHRTVHFLEKTTKLLKKKVKNRGSEEKILLFKMANGKVYKRQEKYLLDAFQKRTKSILGRSYRIHDIRHTTGTHLCEQGADVLSVSNLLGHSNLSVTSIYTKSASSLGKKALQRYGREL